MLSATVPDRSYFYAVMAAWAWIDSSEAEAAQTWDTVSALPFDQPRYESLNVVRFMALAAVADLTARFGTATQARPIYEMMLRYTGLMVVCMTACFGPVDLYLARLAHRIGDLEAARHHIAAATELCTANGITAWDDQIRDVRNTLNYGNS